MPVCTTDTENMQKKLINWLREMRAEMGYGTEAGAHRHFIPFSIILIFKPDQYITDLKKNWVYWKLKN